LVYCIKIKRRAAKLPVGGNESKLSQSFSWRNSMKFWFRGSKNSAILFSGFSARKNPSPEEFLSHKLVVGIFSPVFTKSLAIFMRYWRSFRFVAEILFRWRTTKGLPERWEFGMCSFPISLSVIPSWVIRFPRAQGSPLRRSRARLKTFLSGAITILYLVKVQLPQSN
jgi:hypothetical protein